MKIVQTKYEDAILMKPQVMFTRGVPICTGTPYCPVSVFNYLTEHLSKDLQKQDYLQKMPPCNHYVMSEICP